MGRISQKLRSKRSHAKLQRGNGGLFANVMDAEKFQHIFNSYVQQEELDFFDGNYNDVSADIVEEDSDDEELWLEDHLHYLSGSDMATKLKWVESAGSDLRALYNGKSRSTLYRRLAESRDNIEAAKSNQKIDSFFTRIDHGTIDETNNSSDSDANEATNPNNGYKHTRYDIDRLKELTADLDENALLFENALFEKQQKKVNLADKLKKLCILRYYQALIKNRMENNIKIVISESIASIIFGDKATNWKGRRIRQWGEQYYNNECFVESKRGKHQKFATFINHEDVRTNCLTFLRKQPSDLLTASHFANFLTTYMIDKGFVANNNY